jgi:hypothetical protein
MKQVEIARDTDISFARSLRTEALYDTGASHNFVSFSLLDKLNIAVDKLPKLKLNITVGNNSSTVHDCPYVMLLIKFKKIFENELDIAESPPFSVLDKFFVFDSGQDIIISYPLLSEAHKVETLAKTLAEDQNIMASPEELGEEVIDLAYVAKLCTEVSDLHFSIDPKFPLKTELEDMLKGFDSLFTSPFTSRHLEVDPFKIELVKGAKLKRAYPRRVSPEIQNKVDAEVTRLLDLGIIRRSDSRVCFPIVVAKKPDGSIRLCVDYSELNKWTEPLRFPMPDMELLLQRLTGKKYFSKLDLTMGYHQWLVEEDSIPLTAFVTANGLYEYTRVPFGCMNAPNGFQQKMREILSQLDGVCCEVYMDDILIYGDTPAELILHTKRVLAQLDAFNVLVKPSKCMFGLQELQFLGHVITSDSRKLSPDRVQKVLDLPLPTSVKQLRTFLGLANAFQDYIPNFAMMQKRLSQLCKVNSPFKWSDECTRYVEETKAAVAKAPANVNVTYKDPLVLLVDASDNGVGGVLIQVRNEKHEPVLFFSHAFSEVAKRWSTIEQEAYAIYYGIMKCEHILLCYPFVLMTDHQNLVYIYKATAPKIVRWRLRLQMFQFSIVHIPGKLNGVADALSRLFVVKAVVAEAKRKRATFPVIPDMSPVIPQVCFDKVHNSMVGHHGVNRTKQLLKEKGINWPNMVPDILTFIAACPICQ